MMDKNRNSLILNGDESDFYNQIADVLIKSRKFAKKQVDNTIAMTYFIIGSMIVEREQQGKKRAQYGTKLIKGLSEYLTKTYGKGFSVPTLKNIRQFYLIYSSSVKGYSPINLSKETDSEKSYSVISLFESTQKQQKLSAKSVKGQALSDLFKLTWTHYQVLIRVKNEDARKFYEKEAVDEQWTVRHLQRQIGSSLYERLALSRDKDEVMKLAKEGQVVENPRDIFKTPYIFEFTGLEQQNRYSESDLETALLDNMQKFLLELGKGFLYEARQKLFTFDEDTFYLDLVLYNRLLQCYVIIDLKIGKLKHQDLGQMQMYVNYFDRYVKRDFEKPTVGILICEDRKDKLVELTLPKDSNIYASEYSLYLPDKALLQSKLAEWIEEFEENQELLKLADGGDSK